MRIQFYGTQGSGSVFPRSAEREEAREVADHALLEHVFDDLGRHLDGEGRLSCRLEDILGGPPDWESLLEYRNKFKIEPLGVFGGWTTCVHVETDGGDDIVFDCGSGFRNCAADLQAKWGEADRRTLHLFGSHSHRDHTEGFDQAPVCFDPRNRIRVYGNLQFLRSLNDYLGIFSHHVAEEMLGVQSPIHFDIMPAQFEATRIRLSDDAPTARCEASFGDDRCADGPIVIGDVQVTPFAVYHQAPCLGYCVESEGGKKFVFCTDHEIRRGGDGSPHQQTSEACEQTLRRIADGADVLYRDGQFLRSEYDGEKGVGSSAPLSRLDWGHSCIEDVTQMAAECEVKQTFIGHHDPNRGWKELNWINESLIRSAGIGDRTVELARAETQIAL